MPDYNGPRMMPSDLVGHCLCGLNRGAHKPSEAYYGEERLEGRKSSSYAMRVADCPEYRESGRTLEESLWLNPYFGGGK